MADRTLFIFGAPFGRWASVAPAFLGVRLLDSAVTTWHEETLRMPLPDVDGVDAIASLTRAKVNSDMVARLQAQRPAGTSLWGGADVRLCWTAAALAEASPDAEFLVWVEHPGHLLAQWLGNAGGADAIAALTLIESSMHCAASFVHKHRHRCKVLYTDEAIGHADALTQHFKEWYGQDAGKVALQTQGVLNPLHLMLAEQLVATRPRLVRECERLYASCVRLVEDVADVVQPDQLVLNALDVFAQLDREAKEGAALIAQLRASQAEQAQARDQLTKAQLENHQLRAQFDEMRNQTHEKLRADLNRQTQENELMLVQLHQVQEELEHLYLNCHDSVSKRTDVVRFPVHGKVADIELLAERDTPPHRELGLVLNDVQMADRELGRLLVRLVEHQGRPGLTLLQPPSTSEPLAVWQPDGTEGELTYMLLVPMDDLCRRRLERMGSSDWRFVVGVVGSIECALVEGISGSGRWSTVAKRLAQQLADMPPRFRFDRIEVVQDTQGPPAFVVTYGDACMGSQVLPDIRLRWRPQTGTGDTPAVELLKPDDGSMHLSGCWPVDDTGAWLSAWPLPLVGASKAALTAAWRSFSQPERAFLLGLLDALPAAAEAAAHAGAGSAAVLAAAAAAPLRAAQRLLHGTRLRRVVHAARGRILA